MAIKRVKISGTAYDLDNRLITLTATSGTLTTDQLAILQASSKNYIIYNNNIYNLTSKSTEEAYYGRVGTTEDQNFRINWSSGAYTYSKFTMASQTYVDNAIGNAIAGSY